MVKLIILGSAAAIADERHENTHLVLLGEERAILIDCPGSPMPRLHQAGINHEDITDLILTHFHPDHVSGVPTLLVAMWLLGRKKPLEIYGLQHTLERVEKLMDLYGFSFLAEFYPINYHPLSEHDMTPVFESAEFRVFASPVRHLLPTIGLRIELPQRNKSIAYSSDTEPCPQVVELAHHVDLLIHEATGVHQGHSSIAQAAEVARQAGAASLYLIHYPPGGADPAAMLYTAQQAFSGPVHLAEDFAVVEF